MSNHLHVVLRIRPELAQGWSEEEVALRWWKLFPKRRDQKGNAADPEPHELAMILADPARLSERRKWLASLSWFMRCLCEPIARLANREDKTSGHFWEARFKSQAILDESALLACSVYVDLNPIRAALAETPEESKYTSAYDRIQALQSQAVETAPTEVSLPETLPEFPTALDGSNPVVASDAAPDAWLCELTLKEGPTEVKASTNAQKTQEITADAPVSKRPRLGKRASAKGFLPMRVDQYLELLDWTGRQIREGKPGSIPRRLSPILDRLQLNRDTWIETVRHFGHWFKRAAGRGVSLAQAAERSGRRWFQGQTYAQHAFT